MRAKYIHKFHPNGGCSTNLPFNSNHRINIKNNDEFCLLWCLIAYIHAAKDRPNGVSNYNKSEYTIEIKLPNSPPPYGCK